MSKRKYIYVLLSVFTIFLPAILHAEPYEGFTLFGSNNSRNNYLVDMSNTVVHSWASTVSGNYSYYLLEDGSLLRTAMSGNSFNGGGAQGAVEKLDWDGVRTWFYTYSNTSHRSHHDIEPMPNGNVLMIAWELKSSSQAVAAGLSRSAAIWPDHIIEVQPTGATTGDIVWEWHAWDHLVQDYNASRSNYGVVNDHPELLDINTYTGTGGGGGDWMHVNAVSYNPDLDQIVFSSHNLNEIYIIDHSTTTAEAASHSGGRWGKGGDFLYRWGNPANYDETGTRVFDVVHCAWWVPAGLPGAGHLLAFNNRQTARASMIVELVLPVDSLGYYLRDSSTAYGPASPVWSYSGTGFYSQHLGGNQRLPNGNTIISESTSGFLFEVDSTGQTVWSYNRGGEIVRVLRYGMSDSAVSRLVPSSAKETTSIPVSVALTQNYPNPFNASTKLGVNLNATTRVKLAIYNTLGEQVALVVNGKLVAGEHEFEWRAVDRNGRLLQSGVYLSVLEAGSYKQTKKMVLVK
ncbi:MAG: aryl-sulfate sulfotransferase [bacterium]|nr:aryl-sulfate sulfotransferase [bacterium]